MTADTLEKQRRRLKAATDALFAWVEGPAAAATNEAFDRIKAEFVEALASYLTTVREGTADD